jgi:hypothetical protein
MLAGLRKSDALILGALPGDQGTPAGCLPVHGH